MMQEIIQADWRRSYQGTHILVIEFDDDSKIQTYLMKAENTFQLTKQVGTKLSFFGQTQKWKYQEQREYSRVISKIICLCSETSLVLSIP